MLKDSFNRKLIKFTKKENFGSHSLNLIPSKLLTKINNFNADVVNLHWIGTYLKEVSNSKFNDIENLIKRKTKNTFIYYSGKFKTNEEATSHMMKLKSLGYKNSFVLIQNK